jgi:hypothetical protein
MSSVTDRESGGAQKMPQKRTESKLLRYELE